MNLRVRIKTVDGHSYTETMSKDAYEFFTSDLEKRTFVSFGHEGSYDTLINTSNIISVISVEIED